jgi:hypothetical protein
MTRRHFEALAEIVADLTDDQGMIDAGSLALKLAVLCQRENHRFDRERFIAACKPA